MKGLKDPLIFAAVIGAFVIPGVSATPRFLGNLFSRNAEPEKRTDTSWTNCWTGNGFNTSLGEVAVTSLVASIPTTGRVLRPQECAMSRPIGASMAKFCNVSPRNRTVQRVDARPLFNKLLTDCTNVHGTGVRNHNQFQASLFGTQGWPGGTFPEWGQAWDPEEVIPPSTKKRRSNSAQGRSAPNWLVEHSKRQNANSCADREASGIEYKPYPISYQCTGGVEVLPNGQCPTDGVTPANQCASWCETTRTFYWDAPFYWLPQTPPVCDAESITLQQGLSKTFGLSFGAGWTVGDPRGIFSVSVGVTAYEERTHLSGMEWQRDLFNQGEVCAKVVRLPGKVESCGTLTKCALITIPGGGGGPAPQQICDCAAPENTVNVCAYWDYIAPGADHPLGTDTVEYTWAPGNTHGGPTGVYAGDEWQDPTYLYSAIRPKTPAGFEK